MAGTREEKRPLLAAGTEVVGRTTHLTTFFAVACIVDQFGVNPIIVLPRAIILCGWIGFPLAMVVFSLTIYTAMLLGRCWVIAQHVDSEMTLKIRYPYSALAEKVWGKEVGKFINVYINIAIFCSNIPVLLLASQNLQFFDGIVTKNAFNFSYCYWLVILGIGLCPLTWLGSPKDSKWISVVSTFLVVLTASITWTCMITDDTKAVLYKEMPDPNWRIIGITFGILAFQFGCHPAILTIQTDMHEKTELATSVLFSFLATGGLSLITVLAASAMYGSGVHANLIQGLPPTIVLQVGIICVTLQLFLSSVVGGCSLFQDLEDKLGVPSELCWQRCLIRSATVMLAVLAAEMLPRFDLVMGLLGGLFTGPITFIMPPLLYRKYRRLLAQSPVRQYYIESPGTTRNGFSRFLKRHFFTLDVNLDEGECTVSESVVLSCIVLVGLCATVSATYFSVVGSFVRTQQVPPCIVSVDLASFIVNK
ncbi:UNVERIFIED_CONTAM: hypothetical protein PYX00_008976 [Menopon gallinae]|uniref:Amino acid transporter transmembrane domain-containing protein n=1 Tax=Menopon gallinae TaxID=328185 RepID=A0AAW2H9D8_9NEOP